MMATVCLYINAKLPTVIQRGRNKCRLPELPELYTFIIYIYIHTYSIRAWYIIIYLL